MLRAKSHDGRFTLEVWQPFVIRRGKTVVSSRDDVIEFIERVAIRAPGFSFLIRAEKIAGAIKSQGVRNADAGGYRFAGRRPAAQSLNRAARPVQVVMRDTILDPIRIRVIGGNQAKIEVA